MPADVIFGRGLPLLIAAGVTEKSARSMLGLMRKQHGDASVIDALQACADQQALEPVAFLQKALRVRSNPRLRAQANGRDIDAENEAVLRGDPLPGLSPGFIDMEA